MQVQNRAKAVHKDDSASAISMVKIYQNLKRGKHIKIKANFYKDLYLKSEIDVQMYQPSLM